MPVLVRGGRNYKDRGKVAGASGWMDGRDRPDHDNRYQVNEWQH